MRSATIAAYRHGVPLSRGVGNSSAVYPRCARYPQVDPRARSAAAPWLIRDWLLVATDDQHNISVRHILKIVSRHFGFTIAQVRSLQRRRDLMLARHVWWYLATRLSGQSLPQIGRAAGNRDHTSIMHARDKIATLRTCEPRLDAALTALEMTIKSEPERA